MYIENDALPFPSLYSEGFPRTAFFLNPLKHFSMNEEVTELRKVMLKGKPVKQLDDSNLDRS